MSPRSTGIKNRWAAYGVALAAVAGAVMLALVFDPVLTDRLPFMTLFAAVVIAAGTGGRGPALSALIAGSLAAAFLLRPRYSFAVAQPEYVFGLVLYWFVGLLTIVVFDLMRQAQGRAEDEIAARRAAENALTEREQLLRLTLAGIGEAVITTDAQGNVNYLNAAAAELTGWTPSAAEGRPLTTVFTILHEEDRRPVESSVAEVLREGRAVGPANHRLLVRKDGAERAIEDRAAPILDDQARILGVVLILRDISDRRRIEKGLAGSAERFRLAAEAVNGIIYEYDFRTGRVERTRGLYEVLGYHADEVPATAAWWWEQMHPEDRAKKRPTIEQAMAAGRNVVSEYRVRHRDGRWLHVVDRAILLADQEGRPLKMVGCTVDVTEQRQVQESLRYQSDLNKNITDNATTAIFMMDENSRCTFMNPAAEKMTGFTLVEAQGCVLHDLIHHHHPDGRPYPMRECPIDRALPERFDVVDHEDVFIRKNGELFPVLVNAKPIRKDGVAAGTVIEVRDVTQQKRSAEALQASEQRFRTLAETVPSIIWTAAPDGTITYVNSRRLDDCETAPEGHAPRWPELVAHPDDRQRCSEAWTTALREATEYQVEVRNRRGDGTYRWFVSRAIPFKDREGRVSTWFGASTDIHDQKMLEEQLRENDRRKDEFLATLAHELRNPLAPVRNSLEVMKRARGDADLTEQARATMERQIAQMVRLIDDLLDVSRITRNKLELKTERAELASIVQLAVEACRPACEQAGHELKVLLPAEPIYLQADPLRLSQVFGNLLTNSCKYTPSGGRIRLIAERQPDEVQVTVEDDGIGIPPEMLPEVFDLFTQVDRSLERSQGGLGIGLSLVKRLVEMHGGTVTAHSEGDGRGSAFIVRLPILIESSQAPPSEQPDEPPATPTCRVLVVDDNRDGAESLALLLKYIGCETRTAHDGVEAVEQAAAFRPDVVLLDLGLPKLNGYEACRRIREQPRGAEILIVALTGWGQDEDRRRSNEAGFDDHFVKPVPLQALTNLLADMNATKSG